MALLNSQELVSTAQAFATQSSSPKGHKRAAGLLQGQPSSRPARALERLQQDPAEGTNHTASSDKLQLQGGESCPLLFSILLVSSPYKVPAAAGSIAAFCIAAWSSSYAIVMAVSKD